MLSLMPMKRTSRPEYSLLLSPDTQATSGWRNKVTQFKIGGGGKVTPLSYLPKPVTTTLRPPSTIFNYCSNYIMCFFRN